MGCRFGKLLAICTGIGIARMREKTERTITRIVIETYLDEQKKYGKTRDENAGCKALFLPYEESSGHGLQYPKI